jgi:recyclin-1
MLGHVFIVEDAKDLAQIVRDVTRYGGAYRPEVKPIASTTYLRLAHEPMTG